MTSGRKAVVITGASTGIGRAIALTLDAEGFQVFAGVRKESDGVGLERESSSSLVPLILDVADPTSVAEAADTVRSADGAGLFGLVNNAGIGLGGPLEMVPMAESRKLMEVNVLGLLATTQAFLPMLRRARGRIVNIGSLAGIVALPGATSYSASKFAVEAITASLRIELAPFGIHASIVDPGAIESALWEKGRTQKQAMIGAASEELRVLYAPLIEMGKRLSESPRDILPPRRVAEAVLHALDSKRPRARYLVGPGPRKAANLARMPVRLRDWLLVRFMNTGAER